MVKDEYITVFLKDGQEIESIRSDRQVDAMLDIAKYLFEEQDLIGQIDLPYNPGRRKNPLIERISEGEGEIRRQKHEFVEGYYLDTLANKETKKIDIERLANVCNLNVEFNGAWR